MNVGFLSHFDGNLYQFRLPVMKELVKRGHSVYAIAPKGDFFDEFRQYGIETVEYPIDRASLNPLKEIATILEIKKRVEKLNLDILHSFTHKPNLYGAFVGSKYYIQTVTGLGSFFIHNDLKSKIIKAMIEYGYKITSKRVKRVIFQNSDDLEMFIQRKIVSKQKALLIKSSGIDTNEWRLEQKKKKSKKPIVLMIARVIKDKGVQEFINAAEILKDKAEFWYVGNIDRGNKNTFEPDWKNVKYLGFRKDIKQLIGQCDIFVLPSYREGVPRTLLEAASMSKPIVTTDVTGCKEVVDDGVNGFLVPVRDHKELARKIEILIDNENLREEFGKKSRIKAVREFDVKAVVEKYLEVYEKVLNEN